ncbi:Exonuclease [Methylorubrum aminovorans]
MNFVNKAQKYKESIASLDENSQQAARERKMDAYFSADVETDGPIPGPFSMLSFAIVYAGSFDGKKFIRPNEYDNVLYLELKPISDNFEDEALAVNGLDRNKLKIQGLDPSTAMTKAARWIRNISGDADPVLAAYPLSFDWTWLYWYFISFSSERSPFEHSRCFDIKTAFAVKSSLPISESGRSKLPKLLSSKRQHTHHAIDDAIEQAEIFANIMEWGGNNEKP